jgi:predicted dehydrogenase
MLKQMIDSGLIGQVMNVQHLEPVGWFHYAHSYVRGNWKSEEDSTFLLMAKSCHV